MNESSGTAEQPTPAPVQAREWLPPGLWAVVTLVAWALAATTLLDRSPYGLDEATARAILFLWSVADKVASPIVTLGLPDFRSVYLAPAGVLFSGNLLAVKLVCLALLAATGIALWRWHAEHADAESPLIATGLLLICPLALGGVDTVGIGPFLVTTLWLGAWAAEGYRRSRARFGGFYFLQALACFAAISLHPAGLALPLVIVLQWLLEPPAELPESSLVPGRERTHLLVGIGSATLLGVLVARGWPQQAWFANPLAALTGGIFAFQAESRLGTITLGVLGAALALALVLTAWLQRQALRREPLFASLVVASAIAAFAGDAVFATLSLVILLYRGFALLLRVRLGAASGFLGQRGAAFAAIVLLSTLFLSADRSRYDELRAGGELSAQDHLIRALAQSVHEAAATVVPGEAQDLAAEEAERAASAKALAASGIRVASQWPGRTMIACRCSSLPLPPETDDPVRFVANLRGVDYVLFDPQLPANRGLARGFALLGGGRAETLVLQSGGVLLKMHPSAPPAPGLDPGIRG